MGRVHEGPALYSVRSSQPRVNDMTLLILFTITSFFFDAAVTGCIRPETLDRLVPTDGGGQYDSSGGDGGQGNPRGSKCTGLVIQKKNSLLVLF